MKVFWDQFSQSPSTRLFPLSLGNAIKDVLALRQIELWSVEKMNNLPPVTSFALGLIILLCNFSAHASNHREEVRGIPVEYRSCTFNQGKSIHDLNKAIEVYNAWAKDNDDSQTAWIITPKLYRRETTADFVWLGAWPNGDAWGKHEDALDATGEKVKENFADVMTCPARDVVTSLTVSAPEGPPKKGILLISQCIIADGTSRDDAIADHLQLSAEMRAKADAMIWLLLPGNGELGLDGDYSYWQVLGFNNHAELGAAWEFQTNAGGWESVNAHLAGSTRCGKTTVWRALRVTN